MIMVSTPRISIFRNPALLFTDYTAPEQAKTVLGVLSLQEHLLFSIIANLDEYYIIEY